MAKNGTSFRKGDPRAGRVAGAKNKKTMIGAMLLTDGFDMIGGQERFIEWLRKERNRSFFYETLVRELARNYASRIDIKISGELGIGELTYEQARHMAEQIETERQAALAAGNKNNGG